MPAFKHIPILLLALCCLAPAQSLGKRTWRTYAFTVANWHPALRAEIFDATFNDADLYLRYGAPPTLTNYDFVSATPGTSNEVINVGASTTPALANGVWYAGVLTHHQCQFELFFDGVATPSTHVGMGATVYSGTPSGTCFRVWAPFANSVHLAATFNGWSDWSAPMARDTNGNWSLDVRNVGMGVQYRYVIQNGNQTLWKNDPRARQVTSSTGNSIVVDPTLFNWSGPAWSTPAWNDLVIYEMHVGTFNDQPGGNPGTFISVIPKLPYLQSLGVNCIELMPINEFPGSFSWGYNPSHLWAPETSYGSPNDLKLLVQAAHSYGIAVTLDIIHNHYGPSDLDLWRFDGWSLGAWGGIWFYNDARAQTAWSNTRPDYGRPEVRQFIRDNAMMWLSECRLDGLRWDSTSTMRIGPWGDIPEAWSLLQWVNNEIDATQSWKINIAEDMFNAPNDWITKPTGAGGAGFDAQWDPMFVHPIRAAIVPPGDSSRDMWAVRNAVMQSYNNSAFQRVIYTESHDEVANGRSRVPEEIWPGNAASWWSKKRSTLGAVMTLTAPGIPMLFEGQEILEDGFFADTDPVDWNKLALYPGINQLYRDLIRLRRNLYGNSAGLKGQSTNFFHINNTDKVVAYHRWQNGGVGDDVIVLANFSAQSFGSYTIGLPAGGQWQVRFNSDWSGYDPSFSNFPSNAVTANPQPHDGLPWSASVSVGPYTAIILSR